MFEALLAIEPLSRIAVVQFNDVASYVTATYLDSSQIDDLESTLAGVEYNGSPAGQYQTVTNTDLAFELAKAMPGRDPTHQHAIVLLTDGMINPRTEAGTKYNTLTARKEATFDLATELKNDGALVYTILVGITVNIDYMMHETWGIRPQLEEIASNSASTCPSSDFRCYTASEGCLDWLAPNADLAGKCATDAARVAPEQPECTNQCHSDCCSAKFFQHAYNYAQIRDELFISKITDNVICSQST